MPKIGKKGRRPSVYRMYDPQNIKFNLFLLLRSDEKWVILCKIIIKKL